ncbi:Zinc finger C2CH-type [Trinorchestia longiramus]|nr:Zinc finger C2CH-type [Trinorchestia longiramus]
MSNKCIVPDCPNACGAGPGVNMFFLPADKYSAKLWLLRVGRMDLQRPSGNSYKHMYQVCSKHFSKRQFNTHASFKKPRLLSNALPDQALPNYPGLSDFQSWPTPIAPKPTADETTDSPLVHVPVECELGDDAREDDSEGEEQSSEKGSEAASSKEASSSQVVQLKLDTIGSLQEIQAGVSGNDVSAKKVVRLHLPPGLTVQEFTASKAFKNITSKLSFLVDHNSGNKPILLKVPLSTSGDTKTISTETTARASADVSETTEEKEPENLSANISGGSTATKIQLVRVKAPSALCNNSSSSSAPSSGLRRSRRQTTQAPRYSDSYNDEDEEEEDVDDVDDVDDLDDPLEDSVNGNKSTKRDLPESEPWHSKINILKKRKLDDSIIDLTAAEDNESAVSAEEREKPPETSSSRDGRSDAVSDKRAYYKFMHDLDVKRRQRNNLLDKIRRQKELLIKRGNELHRYRVQLQRIREKNSKRREMTTAECIKVLNGNMREHALELLYTQLMAAESAKMSNASQVPNGDASAHGPDGDASAHGPDGDASAHGPDGDASAHGPDGDASSHGPDGDASSHGPDGDASSNGPDGNGSSCSAPSVRAGDVKPSISVCLKSGGGSVAADELVYTPKVLEAALLFSVAGKKAYKAMTQSLKLPSYTEIVKWKKIIRSNPPFYKKHFPNLKAKFFKKRRPEERGKRRGSGAGSSHAADADGELDGWQSEREENHKPGDNSPKKSESKPLTLEETDMMYKKLMEDKKRFEALLEENDSPNRVLKLEEENNLHDLIPDEEEVDYDLDASTFIKKLKEREKQLLYGETWEQRVSHLSDHNDDPSDSEVLNSRSLSDSEQTTVELTSVNEAIDRVISSIVRKGPVNCLENSGTRTLSITANSDGSPEVVQDDKDCMLDEYNESENLAENSAAKLDKAELINHRQCTENYDNIVSEGILVSQVDQSTATSLARSFASLLEPTTSVLGSSNADASNRSDEGVDVYPNETYFKPLKKVTFNMPSDQSADDRELEPLLDQSLPFTVENTAIKGISFKILDSNDKPFNCSGDAIVDAALETSNETQGSSMSARPSKTKPEPSMPKIF